ncbi:MAG: hypothetical protein ABI321_05135, partial [Polyangia bacterium]
MRALCYIAPLLFASACHGGSKGADLGQTTPQPDAAIGGDAGLVGLPDLAVSPALDLGTVDPDLGPPTCNGYEPCGVNPVVTPTGYTSLAGVNVDNQVMITGCADFVDCDNFDRHFTVNYTGTDGTPVDPYYNRLGSPFPSPGSRYIFSVPPKKIAYVKLHVLAPEELYRYSDGTPEIRTDRASGVQTCFQRGTGHMLTAAVGNLGGTGNGGKVAYNISLLPGDMGAHRRFDLHVGAGACGFDDAMIPLEPSGPVSITILGGERSYIR